nr:uncharacterized protein LOC129414559 [Misgurnus anguillicaudatus]
MDESNPDWAPTLHLGHSEVRASKSDRYSRRLQRQQMTVPVAVDDSDSQMQGETTVEDEEKRKPVEAAQEKEGDDQAEAEVAADAGGSDHAEVEAVEDECGELADVEDAEDEECENPAEDETTVKRPRTECQFCERNSAEINRLLQENRELRSELNKRKMDEEFFKGNTNKVRYYTGIPCFAILLSVFTNVKPFLPVNKKLSSFQMLLLTLIRLRLDLPVQHLAHLFNVSRTTLSTAFTDTIDVLNARLNPLVCWPERHCLQATMPHQFLEAFGKRVAIIVDCFEIRTERPSNLKARAQAFSHYKGTHTIKYLIGITPQGAVSFISKGWGGRASDKQITENCGFRNKLLPGDLVLADRGFDIKDSVGMMCAEVKVPAFTKGRCQLDAKAVENTRAIAHLGIHVERVIGSMRNKYTMIHKRIPISMLLPCEGEDMTLLDKIVNVCCILLNMCPSVVVKPDENEKCACLNCFILMLYICILQLL